MTELPRLSDGVALSADDVRDLVGRAFAGMEVADLNADDFALLERVNRALELAGEKLNV